MATRPSTYLDWTDGSPSKVVEPASSFLLQGWQAGQAPPFQYMNWLFYTTDQWIQYLDQLTNAGVPEGSIRLLNGGIWSFNATSGVLAWTATANLAIPSVPDASNAIAAGSVTLNDGDVAYITPNEPVIAIGNTLTSMPTQITGLNYTANIQIGDAVTGPGIPANTTVLGVGASSVTISNNVTSNNSGATYVFVATGALTVSTSSNTAFIPTISTVLLARRSGNTVYLGVNAAQMVIRDGEFKSLMGSGYFSIFQAPAGQNLTAGQLVYISPGSSDGGRTAGALYPLDVSAANQAVRGTFAGVVITNVSTSATATVMYEGFFAGSSLTAGVTYYADPSTPGGITNVQPSGAGQKIVPVAFAVTSTSLVFTGLGGGGAPSTFPIFADGYAVDTGDHQNFTLPSQPLSSGALFVFIDGLLVPNSLWSLTTITNLRFNAALSPDQRPYFQMVLYGQSYLGAFQEVPLNPSADRKTFLLTGNPVNQASTFVFVDGGVLPQNLWSLTVGGGPAQVVLNSAIGLSQDIYIGYFTSSSGSGASGITNLSNLGGGHGIFAGIVSSVAQLKSVVAGANITITEDSNSIYINGMGGGGAMIEVHGSAASPISIDPTVGFVPTTAMEQVWWVKPLSGSGAVSITATPPIAPGTTVGQSVIAKSVASANYLVFPNVSGVDQDGSCNMGPAAQAIQWTWDGTNWSEDFRRV